MSDFNYAQDEFQTAFNQQKDQQIQDLNKIIIAFRTKVSILENKLAEKEKLPVPQTVIRQIVEMEQKIRKLTDDLEYYKNFVPVQVIINRENKKQPTRKGGLR